MTASLEECQHVELLGAELYSDNYWQQLFFLPAMSGLKVTISLNVPRVDDVKLPAACWDARQSKQPFFLFQLSLDFSVNGSIQR